MKKTDIETLLEKMNRELREKSPSVFSDKTYTDEPILRTASRMKNYEPPEYREMRRISYHAYEKGWSAEHIFYEQAKFMENFEDDYPFEGTFSSYFPTYSAMTPEQQRGYFSWRTKVRRGEMPPAPASFAFVYMYELLNQIGVSNPEEGFFRLHSFRRAFSVFAPEINHYADVWLRDYIAFYDLDVSLFSAYCDLDYEQTLEKADEPSTKDDAQLFEALCALSDYSVKLSPFYREYPEETAFAVCAAFREMSEKYNKTHKTGFADKLFGSIAALPYTVFGSAVFYDRTRVKNHVTELCPLCAYTFYNGQCTCLRCHGKHGRSSALGAHIKYTESVLREEFGFERQLNASCPEKTYEKIALAAARKAKERLEAKKRAEELRYVDTSRLDDIIVSSDKTREMLLTEEEREEPASAAEKEACAAEEAVPDSVSESSLPLNKDEREFVVCLLNGGDIKAFATGKGLKISLLCDGINEKLYDIFCDNVIDFDGDTPVVFDDYTEELSGMLSD